MLPSTSITAANSSRVSKRNDSADRGGTALLLRGREVAEVLGVSRALAYRLMADGSLPVIRLGSGRSVRVPSAALITWIESRTRNSSPEQFEER